jgi:putative membrane protein
MEERRNDNNTNKGAGIGSMIMRVLVSAVVLAVVAFLTPGFTINGIWPLLIAAVVIGLIDWAIQKFTGFDASPFGRGISGFIVSAAVIYFTGYLVAGFHVGIISAIIAALIIGIINAIIPGRSVM